MASEFDIGSTGYAISTQLALPRPVTSISGTFPNWVSGPLAVSADFSGLHLELRFSAEAVRRAGLLAVSAMQQSQMLED